MARPRKPIDPTRRRRLMRTARTMFALRGYNGTALSDILSAAQFPRSSFYYFFTDKAALFDAAFSDGLTLLAERVSPPDPAALTTESFWPEIFTFFDELAAAGDNEDVATIATLFHMRDAPPSASRADFERSTRAWCQQTVHAGREQGVLDQEIPEDLHVELVWSVAVTLDRWLASQAGKGADARELAHTLLTRLFGAP